MPNGGTNVNPDDLGTYRKSEIAQLQTSHGKLLAACKGIVEAFESPSDWANKVCRQMQSVREAIADAEKPSTG